MEEYRVSPGVFNTRNTWAVAGAYELLENENQELYIVPSENVLISRDYNPLKDFPELLKSFLEINNDISEKYWNNDLELYDKYDTLTYEEKIKAGKGILKFVNKYGLLGLFRTYCTNISYKPSDSIKEFLSTYSGNIPEKYIEKAEGDGTYLNQLFTDEVIQPTINTSVALKPLTIFAEKFINPNLIKTNGYKLKYDEYAQYFFPRNKAPFPLNTVEYDKWYKDQDKTDLTSSNYMYWLFERDYSEPIRLFLYEWARIYTKIKEWTDFNDSGRELKSIKGYDDRHITNNSPTPYTWEHYFSCIFMTEPIRMNIEYDIKTDSWQINYIFESLLEAISIMYLQNIVAAKKFVRFCTVCKRPFLASSKKAKHCSTSCGTNKRVQEYRNRIKKEAINLYNGGMSINDISEKLNQKESIISKWIKESEE